MKKFRYVLLFVAFIASSLLLSGYDDLYYFQINKSFDIFGEAFKRISIDYVYEINPDVLLKNGINGMLKDLDPYTVFIDELESESIDLTTYGRYTGLGITVSRIDGLLTISDVNEGFPAAKAGLRIGDHIIRIDSIDLTSSSSTELREHTRGDEGSRLLLYVIRDGISDTLRFSLVRENIQLANIPYSGILSGDIGYVKLDRFSETSADDLSSAIYDLKKQKSLKGLILDLRGNGGGVLDAAIEVSELFIEPGSEIVSIRGRNESKSKTYKSSNLPINADLPLAVLIDKQSASASEIVAGAIQDLDRGIIVGENSFGKGLVQTVFTLPYNTNLKVTTAKYYTPSGRSIQKIDYSPKHNVSAKNDTIYFHTKNGRPVPELVGIMPDSFVAYKEYPEYVEQLGEQNMFFKFANLYRTRNDTLEPNFNAEKLLPEFKKFINEAGFEYKSPFQTKLDELKVIASEKTYKKKFLKSIENLEEELSKELSDYVDYYKKDIVSLLEFEISRRYMFERQLNEIFLEKDVQVVTARELLSNGDYNRILNNVANHNGNNKGKN